MSDTSNKYNGGKLEAAFQSGTAKKPVPDVKAAGVLIEAITRNDVAAVKKSIDTYGENIIERSPYYAWSPLTLACAGSMRGDECTEIVKLLLDNGAKIEARCALEDPNTPLMIAARNFQHEVIALLLARGADPAATDEKGFNARQLMANRAYRDPNAVVTGDYSDDKGLRLLDAALAAKTKAAAAPKP